MVVEEPVIEAETVMVEQDPPIDPSVERATPVEPSLPVSTRTTGMLTSTPQLGPATATPATTAVLPATVGTVVSHAKSGSAAVERDILVTSLYVYHKQSNSRFACRVKAQQHLTTVTGCMLRQALLCVLTHTLQPFVD